jgi:hypothetical protein
MIAEAVIIFRFLLVVELGWQGVVGLVLCWGQMLGARVVWARKHIIWLMGDMVWFFRGFSWERPVRAVHLDV